MNSKQKQKIRINYQYWLNVAIIPTKPHFCYHGELFHCFPLQLRGHRERNRSRKWGGGCYCPMERLSLWSRCFPGCAQDSHSGLGQQIRRWSKSGLSSVVQFPQSRTQVCFHLRFGIWKERGFFLHCCFNNPHMLCLVYLESISLQNSDGENENSREQCFDS